VTAVRILIAGAGIAGLALASALERRGVVAEIVERTTVTGRGGGTGMYLQANAVRALGELGIGSTVTARANPIKRQRILDHRGRRLADIDVARLWGGVGECVALHRADLHASLRAAAARVPIREGTAVTGLYLGDGAPRVTFGDGTSDGYDLVVGADGVHSTVRRYALGGSSIRYVGQVCWRFVAHGFPDISDWTVRLGRGRSFLTVALGQAGVYCYADVNVREPGGPAGDWRELFADFADPVPGLLNQAAGAYRAPIEEVLTPAWTARRVVLVGDAAHAASPNMAQGAALAIEDALVLADELTTGQPVEAALAAYERRRTARVSWVRHQTRRRDRTRGMPAAVRNPVLRAAAGRMFQSHYRPLRERP
jgi:2-polyprenyl-6-methoxyphenol hydroxylase-like FAD-dependent oxidoreductase